MFGFFSSKNPVQQEKTVEKYKPHLTPIARQSFHSVHFILTFF